MSIKYDNFLANNQSDKTFSWAWVKDRWRPVESYRTITKGRKKGWVRVELFDGKKAIVTADHLKNCKK